VVSAIGVEVETDALFNDGCALRIHSWCQTKRWPSSELFNVMQTAAYVLIQIHGPSGPDIFYSRQRRLSGPYWIKKSLE